MMEAPLVRVGVEPTLLRPLASLLSPGGSKARLSILIYHRVLEHSDPLRPGEIDAATFRWHVDLLSRHFQVFTLGSAIQRLRRGELPARAVCITFDDGYADNAETALPILQARGLQATFFIATGFLDGGRMWNDTVIEALRRIPADSLDLKSRGLGFWPLGGVLDRVNAAQHLLARLKYLPPVEREEQVQYLASLAASPLPDNLMLRSQQVRELHTAGMEIGAHTMNHPILTRLDPSAAETEIAGSRDYLETLIGERVTVFAYPNGKPGQDYAPEHVEMVRALGFDAAVSTAWGVAGAGTDRWQLPRFTPWEASPARFMLRMLWNCRHVVAGDVRA